MRWGFVRILIPVPPDPLQAVPTKKPQTKKKNLRRLLYFSRNCLKQIPFGVHCGRNLRFFRRNRLYKKKRDTFVWCINFVLDQLRQSINATSDRTQSMISIVMVAVLLSIIIGISEVSSVDQKEATKKRNHDAYLRSNKYSPMPRRGETLLTLHDRPSSSFDSDTIIFWVSRGNNSRRRRSIKMRR